MNGGAEHAYDDVEEEENSQQWPYSIVIASVQDMRDDLRVEQAEHQHGRCQQRLDLDQCLPGACQPLIVHTHEGGGKR